MNPWRSGGQQRPPEPSFIARRCNAIGVSACERGGVRNDFRFWGDQSISSGCDPNIDSARTASTRDRLDHRPVISLVEGFGRDTVFLCCKSGGPRPCARGKSRVFEVSRLERGMRLSRFSVRASHNQINYVMWSWRAHVINATTTISCVSRPKAPICKALDTPRRLYRFP